MTEEEARAWFRSRYGTVATERVASFLKAVRVENDEQNLISPGTVDSMWVRHALDSAQLLLFAPANWSTWLDIGTGGGFPGMIVALLAETRATVMVEPRKRRAAFLQACVDRFGLANASVQASKVERTTGTFDVISARAVAPSDILVGSAAGRAHARTCWLLPRGRSAGAPLPESSMFHVEHSVTDPTSTILVGRGRLS